MANLVLTVIGDDRPGLVSSLSAPINAHGASWERSQMARLSGMFAGIVQVTVADDRLDALLTDLETLNTDGLEVAVERTDAAAEPETQRLQLELLGADRPGIVAEISSALAEQGVNIEELATDVRDAPMAGGVLFEATAVLVAPPDTSASALRSVLEKLADELMVDIKLS